MKSLTEDEIERYQIQLLQQFGYTYANGYDLQPEGKHQERESFGDTILIDRLTQAIAQINPTIPAAARERAVREIFNIASSELLNNNETFHRYLTTGITVEYQKDGDTRGEPVWLIDWKNLENNEFLAVNQYTVIEDNHNRRPDLVLFINGLPLVVIELKNAVDEKANLNAAYNQLQTYKREIPSLFTYNALLVISDGLLARAGSLTAGFNRFSTWKTPTGATNINELEILTNGMLDRSTLLDLIRHFTVFEKSKTEDPTTGIVSITTVKKVAAYHQYYAVNKAVESIITATASDGDRKGGVIWHTQGSGKSLSMVFLVGKLVVDAHLQNPTIVMLTDRNDLDDQLFDTFAGCHQLLRQDPQQADNRDRVRELLAVNSGGIIFTTVQKFAPADAGNLVPHHTNKKQRQYLAQRLKDPENDLELVIVCDMWLTGFDAPCLHTMYIDKPLKSHNLMQAIARINRVYFEKEGGLIVDYLGLAEDLRLALSFYSQSGGQGALTLDREVAVKLLLDKLEIVKQIVAGFTYQHYFQADTGEKLNILVGAANYVANPALKDRFLSEVAILSRAHSLAVPHPAAIATKSSALPMCLKNYSNSPKIRKLPMLEVKHSTSNLTNSPFMMPYPKIRARRKLWESRSCEN